MTLSMMTFKKLLSRNFFQETHHDGLRHKITQHNDIHPCETHNDDIQHLCMYNKTQHDDFQHEETQHSEIKNLSTPLWELISTNKYRKVNYTEPSPSISLPWIR